MRWLLRSILTLAIAVGVPGLARAAGPAEAPVIDVVTDVADLPANRSELPRVVEVELSRLLAEQEELPEGVFLADDRHVLVELRPGPIPGADDVLIHVAVHLDEERIAESATETCLTCTDEQVAEKALVLLEPLLSELPAPAPPPEPEPMAPETSSSELDRVPSQSSLDRRLWIPGAVLLGSGVVGLGVGIGLIAANERVVSPPDALELEVVKYREAGIATAAIGGAAAVTGAVLLGLALDRRGSSSRLAATPVFGPQCSGISVVGRF